MSRLHPTLESAITGTERRFKWLRFLRFLAFLALAVLAAVLVAGVFITRGWLTSIQVALAIFLAIFLLASLALPVLAIVAILTKRSREWSTGEVENVNPSLLDRLHTLVFLRARSGEADPVLEAYDRRIERQALREMIFAAPPLESESRRTRRLWLACLAVVVLTVLFYDRFEPFDKLRAASLWHDVEDVIEEELFDVPLADAAEIQAEKEDPAWGEVRITEPGRDLKVTKVDVVPLQIEAATSDPMKVASWVTTQTDAEPWEHELPPPGEPRFAVYTPYLYVDELRLADWDVVTYYAKARTAAGEYASDVYFLEVRPFREEIEKLMGAGGSQGADMMNRTTGLIETQKHILRQTYRFLAHHGRVPKDPDDEARRQDQDKLIAAEDELAEAARHLYAEMAANMENQAIADVLDHLAAAEEDLDRATAALVDDPSTALPPEQSALAELVATRKSLQRSITENPEAFGQADPSDEEPFPIADMSDRLQQISEFRDEEAAAMELLDQVLEEQRRIGREIEGNPSPGQVGELAPQQEASRRKLEQFAEDHPGFLEGAREEAERAGEALSSVQEALEQQDPDLAGERQGPAVSALEELREAVEEQTVSRQLQDAYKLKQLLDRQAAEMGEIETQPGQVSGEQAGRTAETAKETTRELKEMMESSPVGQGFGPELHQALSDARQEQLERDLAAVGEADEASEADPGARSRAAGKARQGLEAVSNAFEKSAPSLVRELREQDALTPGDTEALDNAILQLQALVGGRGGSRSRADDGARRREAFLNLRQGLEEADGDREAREALLREAEEALEPEEDEEVSMAKLRRLLEQLERYRTELGGVEVERVELDLAHIDPSKLPAEYRERIQNYYRKLSER